MAHVPLIVSPEFAGTQLRGLYGDAVAEMDHFVGRLIEEIRSLQIDSNTFFVFTSDNGPWLSQGLFGGSAGPFRGGKGTGWEGGWRMPTIVSQPGRVFPGSTQALVSHLDWFPTFAELAGAKLPADRHYDGKSMVPLLTWSSDKPPPYDQEFVVRDSIIYFMNGILVAIRYKAYKVHYITLETESSDPVIQNPPLLFNVEHDIAEQFPLDTTLPQYQQVVLDIEKVRLAVVQTYQEEPAHPPVLGEFVPAVPCCKPLTCDC